MEPWLVKNSFLVSRVASPSSGTGRIYRTSQGVEVALVVFIEHQQGVEVALVVFIDHHRHAVSFEGW